MADPPPKKRPRVEDKKEEEEEEAEDKELEELRGSHVVFILRKADFERLTTEEKKQLNFAKEDGRRKYDYGKGIAVLKLGES